jgi:sugar/nucleoside kinase (ribokinase family)
LSVDLLAVGDVMVDILAGPPVEIRAGGSAVNAAAAAAAAGRAALVVGCVGDDALGDFVRRELERRSVAAKLAVIDDAPTGRVLVSGRHVVSERGANTRFSAEHLPAIDARSVLVSGYQLLRDDSGPGTAAALGLGGLVGVDLGSVRRVRDHGVERTRELLASVDVVFGDEAAIGELGEFDGVVEVATLGAEGARAGDVRARPPRVVPGELLGAGDALAATVLLALADGLSLDDALALGCASASACAV